SWARGVSGVADVMIFLLDGVNMKENTKFIRQRKDGLHRGDTNYCQFYYGGQGFYSEPAPFTIDPRTRPTLTNLTFANNTNNGIDLLPGNFNSNLYLDALGTPYTIRRDDIIISPGTQMTISPGVIVKFSGVRDLYVRGALIANGSVDRPIIFTSLKNDAIGGDTNGDGPSLGIPGDWGGILFYDTSDDLLSSLNFCQISFGGQGFYSEAHPLVFDNASPKVQNTTISKSRSHGVFCLGTASPDFGGGSRGSVGQNRFLGYAEVTDKYAFYNDGTATIYAKSNYWGTTDLNTIRRTIYDFSDNPQKGRVIFEPFTTVEDTEAPQVSVLFPNGGETLLHGSTVTLRWNVRDNVGVSKIDVAISRNGGQTFQLLASLSTPQNEYPWTVTPPFSARCLLKVIGYDAAGNMSFDVSDSFFVIDDTSGGVNYPPSTPIPLRPLAGEEMFGRDLLIWQASLDPNPFDEIRYRLEIDNNADFSSPELVEENIDSSRTSAIPQSLNMIAAMAGPNVLAIRLDRLSGFANLQDDVIYHWRLRASDNRNATSAFSDGTARFFMNKVNTPPQAVNAGFSPANGIEVRRARPTISWQAARDPDLSDTPDVLHYRIQLDTDGEFVVNVAIEAQTSSGITYFVPAANLQENARWFYRVKAIDDEGSASPWSAVQSFWVNAVREPPRTFTVVAPANDFVAKSDTVVFQWQATSDPDPFDGLRYVLEWSVDQQFSTTQRLAFPSAVTQTHFIRPDAVTEIFWRLKAVDSDSLATFASNTDRQPRRLRWQTTSVSSKETIPVEFSLSQNYPNPFNPETTIEFALPKFRHVTIRIFNSLGQEIRTLVDTPMPAGHMVVTWDGKDDNGHSVPSGVYIYQMRAGNFVATKKLVVMR
ncbi:MAG: T9SS type A sorting domain-containing protein, partial [candidate division KSB1 bacterium]|nr:T9SS type A sorting domain-containing protein [candidate division KSB1 bacterium]